MKEKNMKSKWTLLSKEKPTHAKLKLDQTKYLMIVIQRNHSAKGHNYSRTIVQDSRTTARTR